MVETLASFRVAPVYLEEGNTRLGSWVLRKFQEDLYEAIVSKKDAVISAVTGGGKTVSLLLGDHGFVGLYPNNTLLLDQQRSLDKILRLALGAELIHTHTMGLSVDASGKENSVDVLRIYEIKTQKGELPISRFKRVIVVLLSGRYIGYEYDEDGRLVPKRIVILRNIVEKLQGERDVYVITLGTPDTVLMIMAGIYRSFERVGYALHNAIIASVEGEDIDWVLSKYGVATVKELGDLAVIRQYLLKYPWFIDEFHLYGDYEASLLLPVLKVYREQTGWDYPVIFSSATPSGDLHRKAVEYLNPKLILANAFEKGSVDSFVRGETEVEVVAVPSRGKGLVRWLNAGFKVVSVLEERVDEVRKTAASGGSTFIVVDRANQVPPIVNVLNTHGIKPECSVAVKPESCSDKEEPVVVGSESISQGIDRANVRFGIISAYNSVSLIQRFGRIGRKTNSKVLLVVPELREGLAIEKLDGKRVSYNEFVEAVKNTYSNVVLSKLMSSGEIKKLYEERSRLVEAATVIGYAQVSKPRGAFEKLSNVLRNGMELLNLFYGQPEIIAKVLMFRGNGFPVVVEKPSGKREITEVGIVLRNFDIKEARLERLKSKDGIEKKMIVLKIDLEPGRAYLAMEPETTSRVREGFTERLSGMITSIGELASLSYSLKIKTINESDREREVFNLSSGEIFEVTDVREQTLAILKLPDEHVEFYTYTVQGIKIKKGGSHVLGLFI